MSKHFHMNYRIEITRNLDGTGAFIYAKGGRKELAYRAFPRGFTAAALEWAKGRIETMASR